jgi:hypothetical protein
MATSEDDADLQSAMGAANFDDDAAFMMGDFGQELNDDYLGLKELGVDMNGASAVPEQLWNKEGKQNKIRQFRRRRSQVMRGILSSLGGGTDDVIPDLDEMPDMEFADPGPFPPFPSDTSTILRQLVPLIEKRIAESAGILIEVNAEGIITFHMIIASRMNTCLPRSSRKNPKRRHRRSHPRKPS